MINPDYIVATRRRDSDKWCRSEWNRMTVNDARRAYNAGTYELCQGADAEYFYLYAIPRRVRVRRRESWKLQIFK